jgi:hypothetical protein
MKTALQTLAFEPFEPSKTEHHPQLPSPGSIAPLNPCGLKCFPLPTMGSCIHPRTADRATGVFLLLRKHRAR